MQHLSKSIAVFKYPAFAAICLAVFILNTGWGMIIPILPVYSVDLGASAALIGAMFTSFAISRAILQAPGGIISDLYGDKRTLETALLLYAVPTFLFTISNNPFHFIAFRFLEGLAEGFALPALFSIINREIGQQERGQAMGTFTAVASVGLIASPALGGLMVKYFGIKSPFYIATVASLISALIVHYAVTAPQQTAKGQVKSAFRDLENQMRSYFSWQKSPVLLGIACVLFFGQFAYGVIEPVLPVYGYQVLKVDISKMTLLFSINFALFTLVQPFAGGLADRIGSKRQIFLSTLLMACTMAALALPKDFPLFLLVFSIESIAAASLIPAGRKLVGDMYSGEDSGKAFGFLGSISDVGLILGPLASSLIPFGPQLVFLVTGGVGIICLLGFLFILGFARSSLDEQKGE